MTARFFKYVPGWARYSVLFMTIMLAVGAIGWWRTGDWWVYRHLSDVGNSTTLADNIFIVDIQYNDNNEKFRKTVASLLDELGRDRSETPRLVALDIYFTNDDRGMAPLIEAIDRLRANNVKVFAGVDPRCENRADPDPKFMERHNENLYMAHLDGFGHTLFQHETYLHEPYLKMGQNVPSIPSLATAIAKECKAAPSDEKRIVHPVNTKTMEENTRTFKDGLWYPFKIKEEQMLQPIQRPNLRGMLVIVGCLKRDINPDTGIPGPMFISWELNDYILPAGARTTYGIVPPELHYVTITLAITVTLLVFAGLVRTGRRISIHPVALATFASTAALLAIAAFYGTILLTKNINPYVTMPTFAALLSAGLAGCYWHGVLGERAFMKRKEEWLTPPAHEYDLFISYTHEPENAEWVRKNIFEPLRAARRFDGKKLRIFFDTESITVGESWHRKISRSIYLSRHFLAVYSFDYFERDYCRYEMDHAAEIHVHNQKFIMPVVRELPEIPAEYRLIQYSDARNNPAFLEDIINKLTAHPSEGK